MGTSSSQRKFEDVYIKCNMVGKGAFATVYAAMKKSEPANVVAAKMIAKEHISKQEIRESKEEVEIMRTLDHENVVKLYDVFESRKKLTIVMEYCSGGQLLKRIVKMKHYSERDAARVIRQIASAVEHMHSHGVVHRDLKPENILYATRDPDSPIKITDFGLSKFIPQGTPQAMTAACGTPSYVAPEVIMRRPEGYTNKCDLWSVGVILYVLLSGFPPFFGKKMGTLLKRIKAAKYDFKPAPFTEVSEDAKQIIRELLVLDPEKRLSATQLLQKPWVSDRRSSRTTPLRKTSVHIKRYYYRRRVKQAVKLFIALDTLYKTAKGEKKFVTIMGQRQFIDMKDIREAQPRSAPSKMLEGDSSESVDETSSSPSSDSGGSCEDIKGDPTSPRFDYKREVISLRPRTPGRRPRSLARETIALPTAGVVNTDIAVDFTQPGSSI